MATGIESNAIKDISEWNNQFMDKEVNLTEGMMFRYPSAVKKNHWRMEGFIPINDCTIDLLGWFGFEIILSLQHDDEVEIIVEAGVLCDLEKPMDAIETREEEERLLTWRAVIAGSGSHQLSASLDHFDNLTSKDKRWRYVRSLRIRAQSTLANYPVMGAIHSIKAKKAKSLLLSTPVLSKPAKAGEQAVYAITMANLLDKRQIVSLKVDKSGWEVNPVSLSKSVVVLEPGEEQTCMANVTVSERIAPGGCEKTVIHAIPDGNSEKALKIELTTVHLLPRPTIIHDEKGWENVKSRASRDSQSGTLLDNLIQSVRSWQVPEPLKGAFLYETKHAHLALDAAIAWKLTGNNAYEEKACTFIRQLAEAYPERKRACHQETVHEGEFFKSIARAYELLIDSPLFNEKDHHNVERSFRQFINFIDWYVKDGNISNWTLAELTGALNCAQVLQDRERIERFLFGKNGVTAHLAKGTLNDGWWYECSVGYNLLCAGLFSEIAQSCLPWGIDLVHMRVPASYSRNVHAEKIEIDGLVNEIWGPNTLNYRSIEHLWDSLIPFADYRGVVFGISDAAETRLPGKALHFDSRYDLAYYLFRKPEYKEILEKCELHERDLLFMVTEEEISKKPYEQSSFVDNAGVAVLRSKKEGRPIREQIQAAVKYGSHGGAHGHYDRASLLSVMRYGRSFYNPENIWYNYKTFMYKFYVQNSITHNMVTVDLKLQDPVESKRLMFHSGKMMQACAVQTKARWSHPPYGGWMVDNDATFQERSWKEGRFVPEPENPPPYTMRTSFTEPILQRRLTVVTDDYVVVFDYLEGEEEHQFDCIYHMKGLDEVQAVSKVHHKHTEQLTDNPLSSAQFVTDVDWYDVQAPVRSAFSMDFGPNGDDRPNRTFFNEDGPLKMDIHSIWPLQSELIVGGDPEYDVVQKQLIYEVLTDGEQAASGRFGAWILGKERIEVPLEGKQSLTIRIRTNRPFNTESKEYILPEKSIFLGNPVVVTAEGQSIPLHELPIKCTNIDEGNGVGVDYKGGPVKIAAELFDKALPANPLDIKQEGVIELSLEGINAVRFISVIGGDYPVGDETKRRKMVSTRVTGRTASFVTILEPYEKSRMIVSASAQNSGTIIIELADGRRQEVQVSGMTEESVNPSVFLSEYSKQGDVKTEQTEGGKE